MHYIRSNKMWLRLIMVLFLAASTVSVTHAFTHDHFAEKDACVHCQFGNDEDTGIAGKSPFQAFPSLSDSVEDWGLYERIPVIHCRYQPRAPPQNK